MPAHPPGEGPSPETDPIVEGAPPETASPAPQPPAERPAAKTTRERAEAKRQEKLDFMREQVANGLDVLLACLTSA